MPVIVLVADGARPDALEGSALDELPALRRLREEGALYRVASVFPSVTGPAYTPFLMGRFPGPIGMPGLRWFDRSRTAGSWPDYARSYVGHQMRRFDDDLDPDAPTIFELVPNSLAALSVVTRGLAPERRIGALTARSALRAAVTHFRGRAERWLDVDREIGDEVVQRMRDERPDFLFAAFTGVDKASHARGHDDELVHDAMAIVDDVAGRLRDDAERGGWWGETHLWLVSDHGHSPVHTHEDLAGGRRRDRAADRVASVVGGDRAGCRRDGERERDGARVRRARAARARLVARARGASRAAGGGAPGARVGGPAAAPARPRPMRGAQRDARHGVRRAVRRPLSLRATER